MIARYSEKEIRDALKDARLLSVEIPRVRDLDALREEWEADALNLCESPKVPMLDLDPPDNDDLIVIQARTAMDNLRRFNKSATIYERMEGLRGLQNQPVRRQSGHVGGKDTLRAIKTG